MYAYSKLRRENANFKINTKVDSEGNPVYVADPSTGSDEPIAGLLQILPKGLDPYDFLGICVEVEHTNANKFFSVVPTVEFEHASPIDMLAIQSDRDLLGPAIYIPSNGYLVDESFDFSSLAPEGEGGETIIVPENPLNPGTPTPGGEA